MPLIASEDSLWQCIQEFSAWIAPTQSTVGQFTWIHGGDTISGDFFYEPPHATFITKGDTVEMLQFYSLKDPWFEWWIDFNPLRNLEAYETTLVGDSLAFRIYEHRSKLPDQPNARVAYDKGACEPFSVYFYWPEEAGHGFPGADAIYYEFIVTDMLALAPTKRLYLNKHGEVVDAFLFESVNSVTDSPEDDIIIRKMMEKEPFE